MLGKRAMTSMSCAEHLHQNISCAQLSSAQPPLPGKTSSLCCRSAIIPINYTLEGLSVIYYLRLYHFQKMPE